VGVGVGVGVDVGVGVAVGVGVGVGVSVGVALGVGVGVSVGVAVGLGGGVAVAVGVGIGVGVGVGLGAATILKLTVTVAPLIPVPPVELHGVAAKVWFPIVVGVHVKSKGVAESVFTMTPSFLNTTLRVFAFACAVTVYLVSRIKFVPLTNGVPPL